MRNTCRCTQEGHVLPFLPCLPQHRAGSEAGLRKEFTCRKGKVTFRVRIEWNDKCCKFGMALDARMDTVHFWVLVGKLGLFFRVGTVLSGMHTTDGGQVIVALWWLPCGGADCLVSCGSKRPPINAVLNGRATQLRLRPYLSALSLPCVIWSPRLHPRGVTHDLVSS